MQICGSPKELIRLLIELVDVHRRRRIFDTGFDFDVYIYLPVDDPILLPIRYMKMEVKKIKKPSIDEDAEAFAGRNP
ncbi:hypothetical protein IEQ34_016697 [Dendrobium chrysotoxum]|uniref:Uncharacterized protein n=1 Tax=Dendrobium chrysotoxum TaxID=161865 RepID=A0AAV7GH85_DENCH|nr:hypothetical protein IEQ34_016697 [Dendrobium chrysotoxum]